jgi:hypothetical protein
LIQENESKRVNKVALVAFLLARHNFHVLRGVLWPIPASLLVSLADISTLVHIANMRFELEYQPDALVRFKPGVNGSAFLER